MKPRVLGGCITRAEAIFVWIPYAEIEYEDVEEPGKASASPSRSSTTKTIPIRAIPTASTTSPKNSACGSA